MKLERRTHPTLREELVTATLAGGLRAWCLPKPGHARRVALFGVNYGSIHTSFRPATTDAVVETPPGVAHFLEHQLFKKEAGDLFDEFANYGGNANAGTDHTSTCYYVVATGRFEENLDVLLRVLFTRYFSRAHVDRERPIIEQEIRMYDDTPDSRIYLDLLQGLYHGHPLRVDIAGTVESIRAIGPETLAECHRAFYRPDNVTFVACGDLDARQVFGQVERALGRLGAAAPAAGERPVPVLPDEPATPRSGRSTGRMSIARPHLLLGFKDPAPGPDGTRLFDLEVATDAALDLVLGRGGRLANRLYDDGLIDDSFTYGFGAHATFAYSTLGGETDEPDRLRDALLAGIRRARRAGIKKRDFERMRRKGIGKFIRQFETTESAAFAVLACDLKGIDPLAAFDRVRRVSLAAVRERLEEHLDEDRMAEAVLEPVEDEAEGAA